MVLGMAACSKDDPEMPDTPKGKTEEKAQVKGIMPAKVKIMVYNGHLHGYAGFHQNGKRQGTTFLGETQEFNYTMENGKWVADAKNPKYLYAYSYNMGQHSEMSNNYALDIKYFDKQGNDITAQMVANGNDARLQHFFVVTDQKAMEGFDKAIDNKRALDFMRYDYVDPAPFGGSMHEKTAKYNGHDNPLGFKGLLTFGYSRQTCMLHIKLMEARVKKDVKYLSMNFLTNSDISKKVTEHKREVANWVPTEQQLKEEAWYPTIELPVMVFMDWEENTGNIDEIDPMPAMEDLDPVDQRVIKTIMQALNKTYEEVVKEFYYLVWGEGDNEGGGLGYWF